tara:strand:- start:8077 stop:8238 length:162 start_codon:yes stop_codon:yes gene_type:complete
MAKTLDFKGIYVGVVKIALIDIPYYRPIIGLITGLDFNIEVEYPVMLMKLRGD